jgi:hypothetical protein
MSKNSSTDGRKNTTNRARPVAWCLLASRASRVSSQQGIMKRLSTILLAILAALVFAAPAAADELSLAKRSILPGESISYTIKVEEHPIIRETAIAKLMITTDPECLVESDNQPFLSEQNFSKPTTETSSNGPYTVLGTYQVCEYYRVNEVGGTNVTPKIIRTFKVVDAATKEQEERQEAKEAETKKAEEAATKRKQEEEAAIKRRAEEAAKVPSLSSTTPSVKPVAKLPKALKLCKKLKKHSKRVTCEKRAKKRYKK